MQRKLRIIKSASVGQTQVYGITIPPKIALFFENIYFNITKSGTEIILRSGTKLEYTDEQVKNFDLESCKI
ncbi:MAG: hypothetical protein IH948_00215 [Bacteroidetes bacterium]|nr:hypothetical protein [Bacteroidota bacterium]